MGTEANKILWSRHRPLLAGQSAGLAINLPTESTVFPGTALNGDVRTWGMANEPVIVANCILCDPELADAQFSRTRLWEDELWRLSAVLQGPIAGFAHLEPRRHIPFITDLDGAEAATLGLVLSTAARALREAAQAEKTYVYVFGDRTPHLHFNLAPHREGDALRGGPGLLEPGATEVSTAVHQAVASAARLAMARTDM